MLTTPSDSDTLGNINKRTIAEYSRIKCTKSYLYKEPHYPDIFLPGQDDVYSFAERTENNSFFSQHLFKGSFYRYTIHYCIHSNASKHFCSSSGIPRRSNVFRSSGSTSSKLLGFFFLKDQHNKSCPDSQFQEYSGVPSRASPL